MIRPKPTPLCLTLLLLFAGMLTATAADDAGVLRARMDSLRRIIPTKTGADRQDAWTRLYYNAFHIDSDTLAWQVLNEWIADAHAREDYWSESVARQNKIVDFYNTARYDSVKATGTEAMDFCTAHGLTRKYFEAWHLIICSYHITGKYSTAIREGLRMHEEALAASDVFGQSMAYYNMGNVYYAMRHFDQSVKAFEQSVALLQHEDSTESVLLEVYPYYGDALDATKAYQKLEEMTHEWWKHVENMRLRGISIDMPSTLANYYIGRTQALLGLGRTEEARAALDEAGKNVTDKQTYEWLYILYYRAQLAKADGNYRKALDLNTERLRLCDVIEDKPTLIPVHLQRAEILLAAGQYKEAAEMFRRTYQLNDSLNTMQTREQLNEMNTLFQVDDLKMQNTLQQSRYLNVIATLVALALLIFLIYHYIATRRQKAKNEELAKSYAELKLANEKALEASKMKMAFIRNISHEIRTPLNILNGFAQVLSGLGGQLSAEEKATISRSIDDNSRQISELVNKMLEMAETSSQTVIECNDRTSAQSIATGAVQQSGITQTTAPAEPASPVTFQLLSHLKHEVLLTTNQTYATRALRHLIENARKFTRQGTVTLVLTATDEMAVFTVEDTGIGVPEEAREQIFGEFVKLDDFTSGTGIGLSLARNIARKLGGDIVLDAQYTTGARFIMTLPYS